MLLLAVPLIYLVWQGALKRRIVITHRETFTLGFLWYAAMPLYLANADLVIDSPALTGWRAIATLMDPAVQRTELLWAFGLWVAFMLGCALLHRPAVTDALPPAEPMSRESVAAWTVVLLAIGAAAMAFGLAWGLANRALLFSGYSVEYDDVARGPLQGAIVYASVTAVIAYTMSRQIGRIPLAVILVAVVALIVLSLSLGTRSMALLSLIMLAALFSKMRGGLPRIFVVVGSLIVVGGFSAIAAWRQGTSDIGFALLSAALEPLYTYISAATYLAFNEPASVALPTPLIGSLVNLVPRALWPDKVEYLASLTAGVRIYAPLGATHLFASLLMNFGWIGGLVVAVASGAGIERLSQSRRPTVVASYILIVAVLAADIWRNPFSQSVIKSVLQGGVLVPLLIAFAAALLTLLRAPLDPAAKPRLATD